MQWKKWPTQQKSPHWMEYRLRSLLAVAIIVLLCPSEQYKSAEIERSVSLYYVYDQFIPDLVLCSVLGRIASVSLVLAMKIQDFIQHNSRHCVRLEFEEWLRARIFRYFWHSMVAYSLVVLAILVNWDMGTKITFHFLEWLLKWWAHKWLKWHVEAGTHWHMCHHAAGFTVLA